jgi:putative membrane protein
MRSALPMEKRHAQFGWRSETKQSSRMKSFLQRWIVNTLGVLVAANVVSGIRYETALGLFLASLLLGVLNAFVRPLMMLLALPLLIFTLGLFILVINALLLYFVGAILQGFHVDTFGAAFIGALIISLVSMAVNLLLGTGETRVQVRRGRRPPPPPPPGGGGGPIIDV